MIDSNAVIQHLRRVATLTIRELSEEVRNRLRIRAAQNGRSMEAEVRLLLGTAVGDEDDNPRRTVRQRVERLQAAFAPFRAVEGSVVDELIAERRIEAWKENLESLESMTSGKAAQARKHLGKLLKQRTRRT